MSEIAKMMLGDRYEECINRMPVQVLGDYEDETIFGQNAGYLENLGTVPEFLIGQYRISRYMCEGSKRYYMLNVFHKANPKTPIMTYKLRRNAKYLFDLSCFITGDFNNFIKRKPQNKKKALNAGMVFDFWTKKITPDMPLILSASILTDYIEFMEKAVMAYEPTYVMKNFHLITNGYLSEVYHNSLYALNRRKTSYDFIAPPARKNYIRNLSKFLSRNAWTGTEEELAVLSKLEETVGYLTTYAKPLMNNYNAVYGAKFIIEEELEKEKNR